MRITKSIDATVDEIESAKQTAVALMEDSPFNAEDLFFCDDLEYIETGIRKLNSFSNKSWLLSSILLYTLIFNKALYTQSGLTWAEYAKEARQRLGLEQRDISDQLSAARFFILNHAELERQGFNPAGNNKKLARAELATQLCKDVHLTIKHICNDTLAEYKAWYSSYKPKKALPTVYKREDIEIKNEGVYINGIAAIKVSDKIPPQDKERLDKYIKQIFEAIAQGYEPAIVPCYDEREAGNMVRLRDKFRQGK